MQGMETAYVGNSVSAGNASTTVGTEVIKAVAQKYQTNSQIGNATIEIDGFGTLEEVKGDATVSVYTTDFVVDGTIKLEDGILIWGEIEPNVPSIKITNAPETLGVGKNVTLQTTIKRISTTPTVTWLSSDDSIATVDSSGKVAGVAEGDVIITATIEVNGISYQNTCSIEIVIPPPSPQIGDFVNYSAGNWTTLEISALQDAGLYSEDNTTGALPDSSTPFMFGGFKAGDSRDISITPFQTYSNTYSGWRILELDETGKYIIKIIHAGTPEGYYQKYGEPFGYTSENILRSLRDWSMYATGTYGVSAECLKKEQIEGSALRVTGSYYLLATAKNKYTLWDVTNSGNITMYNGALCGGIRPVVTLESEVTVSGSGSTHNTPETAWTLTK